jgi:hypothetical protein
MTTYQEQRLAQGKFSAQFANAWLASQMKPFIEYQVWTHKLHHDREGIDLEKMFSDDALLRLDPLVNSFRDQWLEVLRTAAWPMGELSLSSLDQAMLPACGWPKGPVAMVALFPLREENIIAALTFYKKWNPDGQSFPPAAKDILESEGIIVTD